MSKRFRSSRRKEALESSPQAKREPPQAAPDENQLLRIQNSQRGQKIKTRLLREIIVHLLNELPVNNYDLAIHLISETKMTQLNETVLHHAGSTDVITFDYSVASPTPLLAGEIFVCVDEALIQAKRFKTTWQSELVRYMVHGVLHLQGFDDLKSAARREMKLEENRRLRELAAHFDLSKLGRKPKVVA